MDASARLEFSERHLKDMNSETMRENILLSGETKNSTITSNGAVVKMPCFALVCLVQWFPNKNYISCKAPKLCLRGPAKAQTPLSIC